MDIYKDISNTQNQTFKKLLIDNFSKTKIQEGKILAGSISKISEKNVYVNIPGMKSEAILDIGEIKQLFINKEIKVGDKLDVYLEKIEDSSGNVVVSAIKANKIKGFNELKKKFESGENIKGKFIQKIKGGVIIEDTETKLGCFCPGSQVDTRPLKSFDHLMNTEQEFKIIKIDTQRGNILVSRREVISSSKAEDKSKIIEKYSVGMVLDNCVCKGWSSFGTFFEVNGEIDVLCHLAETSHSRISHPDEVFSIGEKHQLKIIAIDTIKKQISVSKKALAPDPFENISNYEVGKICKAKIIKNVPYGSFAEIEPGLTCLLHSSEISWGKKNVAPEKFFKVNQIIDCKITEIDKEKKRVAISHKLVTENPYESFSKKYKVGSTIKVKISNIKDLSMYAEFEEFNITGFCHANDLSYSGKPEDDVKKFKKGDEIEVKVLEIKPEDQRVKFGVKQLGNDPFEIFKDKKVNDIITVKVKSTNSKGIIVSPEGNALEFLIKKSELAINAEEARNYNRFQIGDRLDVAISDLSFEKRKVSLSVKLLEKNLNAEAVSKFGSNVSGKNLPFSSLSEKLDNKKKEDK